MLNEQLVDVIADYIYRHLRDNDVEVNSSKDFISLSDTEKSSFLSMAHDIICIFDNWFDEEIDEDDFEDDDFEDEDWL